jgi:hypothetical protein
MLQTGSREGIAEMATGNCNKKYFADIRRGLRRQGLSEPELQAAMRREIEKNCPQRIEQITKFPSFSAAYPGVVELLKITDEFKQRVRTSAYAVMIERLDRTWPNIVEDPSGEQTARGTDNLIRHLEEDLALHTEAIKRIEYVLTAVKT